MKQADADALVDGIVHGHLSGEERWQRRRRRNAEASLWKGYVMALLLSMTTMIYGMNVARSIIQEKTSRIFEVMLSIAKPSDLLAGKLIGVGAVGLTQIGIWLVAGAVDSRLAVRRRNHVRRICGALHVDRRRFSSRSTSSSASCSTAHCSRAWPPPARPSRNCRCTCRWLQRLPG